MKFQKKSGVAPSGSVDADRIADLLKGVSTEAFVSMVTKSGLPPEQARELCVQFKRLKS